ncbi:hypothetical protein FHR92_000916 [Fontibacillus solani]|uniref:DUF4367 domain-containing protein n=1 Tax=Fontibacillus solani TaxID=1572857 RepID=A0A7W3SQZ4_9BACL|nr:DUF4367 domain-containing protein [Fontibacillus solani]MBA9084459.1 hypothetical protein [Fontibacillus solani]
MYKREEEQFGADLETSLDSRSTTLHDRPDEYQSLLDLGSALASKDLGSREHKAKVWNRVVQSSSPRKERHSNGNRGRISRGAAIVTALILMLGVLFTQPSLASGLLDKIISTISLGHITVVQYETPEDRAVPVPDSLQGKLFTKDGQSVYELSENNGPLYTAEGEEIAGISNGEIITKAEAELSLKEGIQVLTDPAELSSYTNFKVGMPTYLPEGFEFKHAEMYVDEQGEISPKYVTLVFTKAGDADKKITIHERYADDETAYSVATDSIIEKSKVNGADAIITDGRSIDWEDREVLYGIHTSKMGEKIETSELIRIAESIE